MKTLLSFFLLLATLVAFGQAQSDAALKAQVNTTIRTNTTPNGVTRAVISDNYDDVIDSKPNILTLYDDPSWINTLAKSKVGLGNVDNTSDANKPVSTATQTALDLKANLASPTFTGTPAAPTAAMTISSTQLATTAFAVNLLYYNIPEMYGAIGDGSTNDAVALQACFTASTTKPCMLLEKNYVTGSALTVPQNGHIQGSGRALSIISATANITAGIIDITGNHATLRSFSIDGNDAGAQRGIRIEGNAGFTLERYNVLIEDMIFTDLGGTAIYINDVIGSSSGSNHEGGITVNNVFVRSGGTGIQADTRGEYNHFTNVVVSVCTTGFNILGGNNYFVNCHSTDNANGVLIGSGSNDGHGSWVGGTINHNSNLVTATSTANGFLFSDVHLWAGEIRLTTATGIKFWNCDISAISTLTINTSPGASFAGSEFTTGVSTYTLTATNVDWDGATGVLPAQVSSSTRYVDIALTNAQFLAIRATPQTIVSAPGAGYMIEFIKAELAFDWTANYTETADNLEFRWGSGGAAASETIECTGFVDGGADVMIQALESASAVRTKATVDNAALVLQNTGDGEFGGGNASNVMRVRVTYRIVSLVW